MLKILKHMKPYWKSVIIVIGLLFAQAFFDLSLPTYMSDMIDVGIQNSGIEYATPTDISEEGFENVSAIMTSSERQKWMASYQKNADGTYSIRDRSEKNLKILDEDFTNPITIAYILDNIDEKTGSEFIKSIGLEEVSDISPEEIRIKTEKLVDKMGMSFIHSSAIAFTRAEYEKLGIDLNKMQSSYLWKTGGMMILMSLGMVLTGTIIGFFASRVAAGIGRDLRGKVFNKVVGFSGKEMSDFSTSSLITRSTNDIQQVQLVCFMLLRMVFYAPIVATGGIIMVFKTHADMEWIIVISVLAILTVVVALMSIAMPKFKIMQKLVDKVNLIAREILTGLSVIRAFGREKVEEKRFDDANRALTKNTLFTSRVMTFMMPLMMLIMNGISVLIVWVSAKRIDAGTLEVGTMTAFITYTMLIVMAFLMICMVSVMLPRAIVAAERVDEVLSSESVIVDMPDSTEIKDCKGVVSFNNVSFRYPNANRNTIENISFTANPGETIAIIGSTGCGKSTLVNLIPRFFDVTEGSITLDGVDIRAVPQKELRDNIGYVPQKGVLFSGTIASNICYGLDHIDKDVMEEAARISQSAEFIADKSLGYESGISQGGGNVSGGQKQRLSIARAIAKNPKIYIFDDSFSALDFKTDTKLRKALKPKVKDSTVFIVAQRISTILYADRILVLEDGKLVGNGTHKELLKNCEEYREIAYSQLSEKELYRKEAE